MPKVESMSSLQADKTKRSYCCAGCWSELIIQPDKEKPRNYLVLCPNCDTPGYVTKRWRERQTLESAAKAHDAKVNLREAVPTLNPYAGKQVSELLELLE